MTKEIEIIKQELTDSQKEKLELETTIDDLKHTLKLTEKESQVKEFKNLNKKFHHYSLYSLCL